MTTHCFTKTLAMPFDQAVSHVTEGLAAKGFGVLTTIDVRATMKREFDIDFKHCTVPGARNQRITPQALKVEDKTGTMLPCDFVDGP